MLGRISKRLRNGFGKSIEFREDNDLAVLQKMSGLVDSLQFSPICVDRLPFNESGILSQHPLWSLSSNIKSISLRSDNLNVSN